MITDALKYLIGLAEPKIVDVHAETFTTHSPLYPVLRTEPVSLVVHTLTGLVDYINADPDGEGADRIVHVDDFDKVSLRSKLQYEHSQRFTFLRAEAIPMFGDPHELVNCPVRSMIIRLGTCFAANSDREKLIRLIGNINDASATNTQDDGITQQVKVKVGISLQGVADMPSTVELLPWRTFPEIVPQPSKWLVRVDRGEQSTGPLVSLFEVNREQWRASTIAAIESYLKGKLGEKVIIIA